MATLRSDVIIPEVFTPYLIEATTVRNSFLTSGVVTALDALNVNEGGDKVTIPNWKADLSGDAERLTDTTSLTPGKITADKQIGVVLHRGRAWESRDLARLAAGSDPMGAIGAKVADYIANQQQKDMIASLQGVFGALGSSNSGAAFEALCVDATGSGETNLGPRQIAAAEVILNEDSDKLGAIVMHPRVYADLKERKAIDFVTATDARVTASTVVAGSLQSLNAFGGSVAAAYTNNIAIPFYMGMRVIRSKDVPTSGTGATTKYACYVMATGAVGTGQQAALRSEVDRDILAKSDAMSVDWHNVYHPLGARYTGSANPTTADLATAGNWQKVFETENIGIVRITVTSSFD
ncbi:MAG: hypothetical protein ACO3RX_05455 [Chthoniobacterales bacterium]|jgi:hypothetical protein